ncbi:MAG: phosphotransferase [Chthonomonadales bacterium]|nr:phosphotransferase [Chthonomonadales bacterium]
MTASERETLARATERVSSRYDVGEVIGAAVLEGGMFLRPVLLTTTTGRYVLRAHTFRRTEARFGFQAGLVEHAAAGGVRCARVVRDRRGRWGEAVDGAFVALHEYADGRLYTWPEWSARKREGFLRRLGGGVARVHDALADARPVGDARLDPALPPIQFDRPGAARADYQARIAALREARGAHASRARAALLACAERVDGLFAWLGRAVEDLRLAAAGRQAVHGDISPVNMVFAPDSEAFALIDWDCARREPRIYDALGDVLLRAPWDAPDDARQEEVAEYLAGYGETTARPLTATERAGVPAFCVARQLEDLRQRLAVLPRLAESRDTEYAALVAMRLACMERIVTRWASQAGAGRWKEFP